MQLIIAVNCSSRKTALIGSQLRASNLPKAQLPALAAEWRARATRVTARIRADSLYNGRAFVLAKAISESAGAELHILSAGMGLVRGDALIPAYSLTVIPGTKDSILNRASRDAAFSTQQWWHAIQSANQCTTFAGLLGGHPKALVVIAANSPYIEMVSDELAQLDDTLLKRVRIVGVKVPALLTVRLRACVMPYDERLNDDCLPLRGTEFDYPARALTHFVNLISCDRKLGSAENHARRVRQSLAHLSAPQRICRQRIDDKRLRRIIKVFKERGISKTKALNILRHENELACEQSRFSHVWAIAK